MAQVTAEGGEGSKAPFFWGGQKRGPFFWGIDCLLWTAGEELNHPNSYLPGTGQKGAQRSRKVA